MSRRTGAADPASSGGGTREAIGSPVAAIGAGGA